MLGVLFSCRRPSAVQTVFTPTEAVIRIPLAPRPRSSWWRPEVGSFQSATARESLTPGGVDRAAIPNDVRVSTADPGSSVRTEA